MPTAPASLELFAQLATQFHAETNLWPPGNGVPGIDTSGLSDAERARRWAAWLRERNRAADNPDKPPKGQLSFTP